MAEEDAYVAYLEELDAGVVYCSICDAPGHGRPGYGPCPVYEERPWHAMQMEDEERREKLRLAAWS